MAKFFLFFILFILFLIIRALYRVTRTAIDAGKAAYDSVTNSRNFDEAYQNFAKNLNQSRNSRRQSAKHSQLQLLEEVVALMAKVAASDGRVSRAEVEYMSDTIVSMTDSLRAAGVQPSITEQIKQNLFSLANSAKRDNQPLAYYTRILARTDTELRKRVMLQLISFASIDGMSQNKLQLLVSIGANLGFNSASVQQLIQQVFGNSQQAEAKTTNPYEVLGCQASDSFDTIKLAYRRLVKKYHPDYMHGQGADDEAVQQATQKIQEINAAYELIKKMRG
ncbi:DnaJ domain-containing protein [Thiopseudomonas alkaliphila]|uniref:DnaJ domain-containing protein n=1 Tax=Thiopseudomonas alkaliphila TaxID=1697053 RepID=UPI00069D1DD2|nr:DnaJ domain-containing protein [Thiopseudomonas alkaliphila]AKX50211.1 hypothetical protein AKN92_00905 [Thiopseudomonas alkaliphila]AKX56547.1 hypothetical protein AKN89_00905 [Thiopseudomonas alkaliphila]